MKVLHFVKLGIYIAIGVLLAIFRDFIIENLSFTVPAIFILYGVEAIGFTIFYHPKDFHLQHRFYWGIVELLLGVVVLAAIIDFETVCIVWAIWSILREAEEIRDAVQTFDSVITSIISIVTGIINVVFSVLLIIHPGPHHAMTHLYLLIVELTVASSIPIIDYYLYKIDYKDRV